MKIARPLVLFLLFYVFLFPVKAQKVGLVLSGGGVRGFAHIGAIKALEENNIPIDYITGTSAGALIGSMYAQGLSPQQMEKLVLSPQFRDWATGNLLEDYSFYFKKKDTDASWVEIKFSLDSIIKTHLPSSIVNSSAVDWNMMENTSAVIAKSGYDFDNLFVPFRCVAADIVTKSQIVFNCGDLGQAVRSSMAYPLYFNPVTLNNRILFDGGIYNNFPYDVMLRDFSPEVMIGVGASGTPDIPYEDNIFSQVKNLIVQTTNYILPGDSDVMITPNCERINLFDFTKIKQAIDSGYSATIRRIPVLKQTIKRVTVHEELEVRRKKFLENLSPLIVDKIIIHGINDDQAAYVRKILNPGDNPIPVASLKQNYFKLIADDNIRYIFPKLIYNPATGYYDLDLTIKQENNLRADFGGNFSSRPISEGFIALQYNLWGAQSLSIQANTYFGKLYSSTQVKFKLDFPGRLLFSLEPYLTFNRLDFFSSSTSFFEDLKPSYLIQSDRSFGMDASIPARNKGKITGNFSLVNINNEYYQTREFSQTDTADQTELSGYSAGLLFERNTLNRKMYASSGTYLNIHGRFIEVNENTQPGTTAFDRKNTLDFRHWWQVKMTYDNYFKSLGPFHFGFYSELNFSSQPFFSNYTATMLSSPDFQPTVETKTLFLDNFRAFNYTGAGLKNVLSIRGNVDIRLEGYIFQPFQEIKQNPVSLKPFFGNAFSKRYYVASLGAVYHSPIGPVNFSVNYYDDRNEPFTFLFHFGYIIFNRKAIE